MDFGIGEDSFESGRNSAWVVVAIAIILIASISGWILLW
jgi:succinate dehydrogenase / fumarate reductase cytochrome b subunit